MMKKTCEAEIQMRLKFLQNKLKDDEKSMLQQLESFTEEELNEGREIQFQPSMLESVVDIFGYVAVDGILPSHLSLSLLSQLMDFREGATLKLEVAESKPGLVTRDSWQKKIVITVVAEGEDG